MLVSSMPLSIILLDDGIISCALCSGGVSPDHLPSINPLHRKISIDILHTIFLTFPKVLTLVN